MAMKEPHTHIRIRADLSRLLAARAKENKRSKQAELEFIVEPILIKKEAK